MSSQKRAVVVIQGVVVVESMVEGFYIVTIDKLKHVKTTRFYPKDCFNMRQMRRYIDSIPDSSLVLMLTAGYPFSRIGRCDVDFYKMLGCFKVKLPYITRNSNWMMLGTKEQGIRYQAVSEEPVFYPHIEITDTKCIQDNGKLHPYKSNYFFRDLSNPTQYKLRCAMEANVHGSKHIALVDDHCIPLTDEEFKDIQLNGVTSERCFNSVGSETSASVHTLKTSYTSNQALADSIHIYNSTGFKGRYYQLPEGEYDSVPVVGSIIVPESYYIYLLTDDNQTHTYFNRRRIDNLDDINIKTIGVKRYKSTSVIFCTGESGDGRCYIYGPGRHTLPKYLFMRVNYVNLGPDVNEVAIFEDVSGTKLIERFNRFGGRVGNVRFPRYVRSIIIR